MGSKGTCVIRMSVYESITPLVSFFGKLLIFIGVK